MVVTAVVTGSPDVSVPVQRHLDSNLADLIFNHFICDFFSLVLHNSIFSYLTSLPFRNCSCFFFCLTERLPTMVSKIYFWSKVHKYLHLSKGSIANMKSPKNSLMWHLYCFVFPVSVSHKILSLS